MIRFQELRKAYGAKTLFRDASYHFPEGTRVAVVGANGVGKTTLLNILCGIEEADAGEVLRPGRCVLGYLPQEPNGNPAATILSECIAGAWRVGRLRELRDSALTRMSESYTEETHHAFEEAEEAFRSAGGYSLPARSRGILSGLGFRQVEFDGDPRTLSGGWRMRLELARVLVNNPDFLVLDEPTNHLDLPSLAWFEKFLYGYAGTLVFVSHDRHLLNRLATHILHMHHGRVDAYVGNFDNFLEERDMRMDQDAARLEQLRARRAELEKFVSRFGAKATKARQAQSRMKMIARLRDLEAEVGVDPSQNESASFGFSFPPPPKCGREVFSLTGLHLGYTPDKILFENLNLRIWRGQKIAVIGVNGVGKSTLLKTLANAIPPLAGKIEAGHEVRVAWFAQNQMGVLDEDASVVDNVLRVAPHMDGRAARSLLGSFLFRGDDVFKPAHVLSGGERSRLGLARLLVQDANVLLLDEPTNHLDLTSVEILSEAISSYDGTVIFVSHHREFIDSVCTHVLVLLPDGRMGFFTGNLSDYETQVARTDFPNILDPQVLLDLETADEDGVGQTTPTQDESRARDLKRDRQRLEKEIVRLEQEMGKASGEVERVSELLSCCDVADYQQLMSIQNELTAAQKRLSVAESEWLECSERLESVREDLASMGRL